MRAGKRAARRLAGAYLAAGLALMYLPIAVVIAYSFNKSDNGILWTGFTTEWYGKLFQSRQILEAFRNSMLVACVSCLAAAVIGTLGAVGLARAKLRGLGLVEGMATLPMMVPEIILGFAFMVFFSLIGLRSGILTLILAHTTFCVPYILINVRSRLVGLDPSFEEAARDLGAGPVRAFWDVTVPLIAPAILSGVLLAFAMSLDDVVISFFVTGPESATFPVYVYSKLKTDVPPSINAMCTLTLGVTFLAVALSRLPGRRRGRGDAPNGPEALRGGREPGAAHRNTNQ